MKRSANSAPTPQKRVHLTTQETHIKILCPLGIIGSKLVIMVRGLHVGLNCRVKDPKVTVKRGPQDHLEIDLL